MAVDRRKLLMGGGAAAVIALAIWQVWPVTPPPATASAGRPVRARGSQAAAALADAGPVGPVKLSALKETRDEPSQAARNPFRFQPRVAPPRPLAPPSTAPVNMSPPRPAPPPGPPPAPPIPMKFIGVLTREDGVKWAVLTDGKSVQHGKEGSIIEGRYIIVKIGEESIEMTYVDGRGRQVIRLNGQ